MHDLVDREQPDVVCLQELKATPEQVPETVGNLPGYWCYWHGSRAYSGIALHLRKDRFPEPPDHRPARRVDNLTSSGHLMTMKRAKVAELKAHLSEYLAEVRGGATVVVCDRNTPIARLVPYEESADGFVVNEPRRAVEPVRSIRGVKPRRRIDVVRLLRASRDHR